MTSAAKAVVEEEGLIQASSVIAPLKFNPAGLPSSTWLSPPSRFMALLVDPNPGNVGGRGPGTTLPVLDAMPLAASASVPRFVTSLRDGSSRRRYSIGLADRTNVLY